MKSFIIILLHAGYWLAYLLLITFFYVLPLGTEPFPSTVLGGLYITLAGSLIPSILGFYVFYFILVPRLLAKRDVRGFLAKAALASVVIGIFTSLLSTLVLNHLSISYPIAQFKVMQETAAWRQFWLFLGFSFIAGLNGITSTVLRGFVTWYLEMRIKEKLEKDTLKTQLELLKTQLHPHFLFNTLNNIDSLINEDADAASKYLSHLSGMLRFMLYQSSQDEVPLENELEYVTQYLELQRIRTDNKEFVEFSVKGNPAGFFIAPLLFLPFLENAFKYSNNKKISKAITIHIDIDNGQLIFSCRNIIANNNPPGTDAGGLGLHLVRKRLELLYANRHQLTIQHTQNMYCVELSIHVSNN